MSRHAVWHGRSLRRCSGQACPAVRLTRRALCRSPPSPATFFAAGQESAGVKVESDTTLSLLSGVARPVRHSPGAPGRRRKGEDGCEGVPCSCPNPSRAGTGASRLELLLASFPPASAWPLGVWQFFLAGVTDGRFCDGVPKARLTLATGASPWSAWQKRPQRFLFFNPPQGRPPRQAPLRGTERRGTWGVRGPRACGRGYLSEAPSGAARKSCHTRP